MNTIHRYYYYYYFFIQEKFLKPYNLLAKWKGWGSYGI
jgi:hypothetical protein